METPLYALFEQLRQAATYEGDTCLQSTVPCVLLVSQLSPIPQDIRSWHILDLIKDHTKILVSVVLMFYLGLAKVSETTQLTYYIRADSKNLQSDNYIESLTAILLTIASSRVPTASSSSNIFRYLRNKVVLVNDGNSSSGAMSPFTKACNVCKSSGVALNRAINKC